eukprot:1142407-Pelagomonas_calceolata.AAC.8
MMTMLSFLVEMMMRGVCLLQAALKILLSFFVKKMIECVLAASCPKDTAVLLSEEDDRVCARCKQVFGMRPPRSQIGSIEDATRWGGMFERLHASYLDPNGVWRVYTQRDGPSDPVESLQVRSHSHCSGEEHRGHSQTHAEQTIAHQSSRGFCLRSLQDLMKTFLELDEHQNKFKAVQGNN